MTSELSRQSKFDEDASQLDHFLDGVQSTLGEEDPNKSMEESIIRVRLDDLKDTCKDFRHRQQDLDALNDLGYRLPLKKTDAERLHNLNNRYYLCVMTSHDQLLCF